MFGNTSNVSTGSTFGATNTNAFSTSNPLFASQQQRTSLFGQSSFGATSAPFGASSSSLMQAPTGTTIKFNPVTGTDSMMRNGVSTTISTRHQCITCMKEYEGKSFEELRLEDYQANRKGPQGGGGGLFGQQTSTAASGIFGSTSTQQSAFGTTNAGLFGGPRFSQPTTTTTNSLFGSSFQKPPTSFGTFGTSNTTFPSLQPQPLQNQQQSLFGTPASTGNTLNQASLFNAPQSTASKPTFQFGAANTSQPTGFFGSSTNLNTALNKPFGFGNTSTAPAFGSSANTFITPNTGTLFSTSQPSFGFNTQTSTANQPNKSLFQPSFGAQPLGTGPFGATSNTTSQNLFGNTNIFGSSTGSSLFGSNPTGSSMFSQSTLPSFGQQQPLNQSLTVSSPNVNNEQLLTRLQTLPYGNSPLFQINISLNNDGASSKTKFTTDPKTLHQYRITAANSNENKLQRIPNTPSRNSTILFDGLEDDNDEELKTAKDIFTPRKSVKKLVIKPKNFGDVSVSSETSLIKSSPPKASQTLNESPLQETTMNQLFKHSDKQTNQITSTPFVPSERSKLTLRSSISSPSSPELSVSKQSISQVSYEEAVSSQNREFVQRKCGVIQTRSDYYTIPSLDELDALYNESTDTCFVENFTIGRQNYGSIYWQGPLDVKGLNLDEIVHIRRKEVIVYPDPEVQPEEGDGLNRPAQITLHQVWPIDKTTHETIKDPERLKLMKYAEKIEKATINLDANFKEYRPDTGSWVFTVKHFSKYGLSDDDEEMEEVIEVKQTETQPKKSVETIPTQTPLKEIGIPTKTHLQDQQSRNDEGLWYNFPNEIDESDYDLKIGEEYQSDLQIQEKDVAQSFMKSCLFDDIEDDEENYQVNKKQKFRLLQLDKLIPEQNMYLPIVAPPMKLEQRKKRVINYKSQEFAARKQILEDISSICPLNSSRICFFNGSKRFTMINNGIVNICELRLFENSIPIDRFEEQREKNSVITSSSNPQTIIAPYIETRKFARNSLNNSDLEDLIVALFATLKETSAYASYNEISMRIKKWLFAINKKISLPSESNDRIIHFLSTNELQAAAFEALNSNQPRLALLISSGTNVDKDLLLAQLDIWKKSESDQFISNEIIKIYVLLSGQIKWKLSNGKEINILENLVWTQQIALLLLYSNHIDEENVMKTCISRLTDAPDDVEYHLMQCTYDPVPWPALAAATNTMETWFLHESLRSFDMIKDEEDYLTKSDDIHCTLASQLDDIRWACFVILHIKHDIVREMILKEILTRNYKKFDENDQIARWLSDVLLIPNEYLAEAKAIGAKSSFDYEKQALSLLEYGSWNEAHDVLVEHVFPGLVILEQIDVLDELLSQLLPNKESIANWTSGGHIYSCYLECLRRPSFEIFELFNVHNMKCTTKFHVLCQSEMQRKANFIYSQLSGGTFPYNTPIPDDYALMELKENAKKLAEILC